MMTRLLRERWFWFAFCAWTYLLCWDVYIVLQSHGKAWPLCAGTLVLSTMPLTLRMPLKRALQWITGISLLCLFLLVPILMIGVGTFSFVTAAEAIWVYFAGSILLLPQQILESVFGMHFTGDLPLWGVLIYWTFCVAMAVAGAFVKRVGDRNRLILFAILVLIVLLSLRGCEALGLQPIE